MKLPPFHSLSEQKWMPLLRRATTISRLTAIATQDPVGQAVERLHVSQSNSGALRRSTSSTGDSAITNPTKAAMTRSSRTHPSTASPGLCSGTGCSVRMIRMAFGCAAMRKPIAQPKDVLPSVVQPLFSEPFLRQHVSRHAIDRRL